MDLEPYVFGPPTDDLSLSALARPSELENVLRPILYDPELPAKLSKFMDMFTNRMSTPEIPYHTYDPGRPSNYFRVCLVYATLIGRAYALTVNCWSDDHESSEALDRAGALPPELRISVHEAYLHHLARREPFWRLIADILAKALFSTIEPEPGARYAAGIILLTAGQAIKATPFLDAHGKEWIPWISEYDSADVRWTWREVEDALVKTADLPRNNTNSSDCFERALHYEGPGIVEENLHDSMYISHEMLDVLDAARAHIKEGRDDLSSAEVMERFLGGLDAENNETSPVSIDRNLKDYSSDRAESETISSPETEGEATSP
ncbi:hypothetical protein LTR66_000823 [Elasticomyces elasticus]|nr:hypothetical protein LTR66_000823 [Elasticomyces elasticus]